MENQEQENLRKYILLLDDFITHKISILEFEKNYLHLHRHDSYRYSQSNYETLAILFSDVDAYCSNPDIRDEHDLDDAQLFESALKALSLLKNSQNTEGSYKIF